MTNSIVGITGASGVLGRILKKKLKKKKIRFSCFKGDILYKEEIKRWLSKHEFHSIVHLAAIVPTVEVDQNPKLAYEVNVTGTKNLVEELNKQKEKSWIFYASTSHVYQSKNNPIKENDKTNPISEYGRTKLEAEKIIQKNYKNYCIGRIFSFYHKTQKKPFLYPTIKERLKSEDLTKPFKLYGAGSIRDFLNAEEVANIILQLMEKKVIGIYNIASGKGIKIKDFVQDMNKKKLEIKGLGKDNYLVADISKFNKVLNLEN